MGERSQLLVNVMDEKGNQLCGTMIHYQWGCGRVMPMDALNLAINLPWSYQLQDSLKEKNVFYKFDKVLKKDIGLTNPLFARNFRNYLANLTSGSLYEPYQNLDLLREYNSIGDTDQLDKFLEKLDSIYNLNINDLEMMSFDNNCGYMIMDILYQKGSPDRTSFKFKAGYELGYSDKENLTFEQYCKAQDPYTNNRISKYNFIESYRAICKGYNIYLH